MTQGVLEKHRRKTLDRKKILKHLRRLEERGLGDRFKGMSEEEVIKALKKTRAEIWQEKLAGRP